jgi:hypothetical protein
VIKWTPVFVFLINIKRDTNPWKKSNPLVATWWYPYSPNLRPANESHIGPRHYPGIHSMHTSKIREIMALLSPLYQCEMLKNAKVQVS